MTSCFKTPNAETWPPGSPTRTTPSTPSSSLIGEPAHRAMGRNSTVAAVRAIGDRRDPLATLTLLWLLQRPVSRRRDGPSAARVWSEPLLRAGIVSATGETVVAAVDIRPYASDDGASGWIVSDLSPGLDTVTTPMRPDFVLGVSSASTHAGPADPAAPGRTGARPGHRLRRAEPAPGPARPTGGRHRPQPPGAGAGPADHHAQRGRRWTCGSAASTSRCAASGST